MRPGFFEAGLEFPCLAGICGGLLVSLGHSSPTQVTNSSAEEEGVRSTAQETAVSLLVGTRQSKHSTTHTSCQSHVQSG